MTAPADLPFFLTPAQIESLRPLAECPRDGRRLLAWHDGHAWRGMWCWHDGDGWRADAGSHGAEVLPDGVGYWVEGV